MINPTMPVQQNALVSVVVPVFNEAGNILSNIDLLIREIEKYFSRYEVIIISDGSTDETNIKLAQVNHPRIETVIHSQNQGKGAAIRSGFQVSAGDYIFFIDGGMELHPRELGIFLGLMNLYEADIIIGSKRHPQSRVFYPWYRKLLSRTYQLLIALLFRVDVTDTQVGIKLFRKEVVEAILPYLEINRYGFDLEILSLASALGYRNILEAPIRLDYFLRNRRFVAFELMHVFRVGASLLKDTFLLYLRLRRLRREPDFAKIVQKA